jgi:hypothetical protein
MDVNTPNTTEGPQLPGPTHHLTTKQELWARGVAMGLSYGDAFRAAGYRASNGGSMANQIQGLKRLAHVRARINELRPSADAVVVSHMNERMAWLKLIVEADAEELTRVVTNPCDLCWPDVEIAKQYAAHFAPPSGFGDRPGLPDTKRPRSNCVHCRGDGISRVVLTPTAELSPGARALFKGATQNEKGVIEIKTHDQMAASEMLNKMQSVYLTRSLSLTANVSVPAAKDVTGEQALALFESFK